MYLASDSVGQQFGLSSAGWLSWGGLLSLVSEVSYQVGGGAGWARDAHVCSLRPLLLQQARPGFFLGGFREKAECVRPLEARLGTGALSFLLHLIHKSKSQG